MTAKRVFNSRIFDRKGAGLKIQCACKTTNFGPQIIYASREIYLFELEGKPIGRFFLDWRRNKDGKTADLDFHICVVLLASLYCPAQFCASAMSQDVSSGLAGGILHV